jgi:hypothetical protein
MGRPQKSDVLAKMVQVNLSGELRLYTERVQRQLIKSIDEMIGNGKGKMI